MVVGDGCPDGQPDLNQGSSLVFDQKQKIVVNLVLLGSLRFYVVGATGLEPAASWSQTKRSTKLSYAPIYVKLYQTA